MSPRLEKLMIATGKKNLAADIQHWQGHFDDNGATFYYMKTRKDPAVLPPSDAMGVAYYLAADSPKLQYLARLNGIPHHCKEECKNLCSLYIYLSPLPACR